MKKVLIGLGIGCGVIILIGVGMVVAGGVWMKNRLGGGIEAVQKIQTQEMELAKLDQGSSFREPSSGQVLPLDEKRLDAYLAVRESALPIYTSFEQKTKDFQAKHGDSKGQDGESTADFGSAMEGAGLLMTLVADVRDAYITGLKAHAMSPSEFKSITGTVYASIAAEASEGMRQMGAQARQALAKQVGQLDKQLESGKLEGDQREQVKKLRDQLQTQLDTMGEEEAAEEPSEETKQVVAANVALLKKFEERIKGVANTSFDAFILGGAGSDSVAGGGMQ